MSNARELQLTAAQAREFLSFLTWGEVRMVSFDHEELEILLKDERRVRVALENSEQAYEVLAELRRDPRDEERGA